MTSYQAYALTKFHNISKIAMFCESAHVRHSFPLLVTFGLLFMFSDLTGRLAYLVDIAIGAEVIGSIFW